MSDSDPDQLRLNLGSDDSSVLDELGPIESPPETEVFYLSPQGEEIGYDKIDESATAQGILPIELISRQGLTLLDEAIEKPRPKRGKQPVETILAERAIALMGAAYQYREAAKYDAEMRSLVLGCADSSEIDQAMVDEMSHRLEGDAAMSKLNRIKDLEKAGFSPIGQRSDASRAIEEFKDLSTNPGRQDELIELVKVLITQKKPHQK